MESIALINEDKKAEDHARAELIREHTAADYYHVLAAYGSAYANGWKFGRDRAADLIEGIL